MNDAYLDDSYPLNWANVFIVRLQTGHEGAWHKFRGCLNYGPCLGAFQKAFPPSLLSELLAAAAVPEADPAMMRRVARRLGEWVQSEVASKRPATRTSDK
jgi:hypothetical protein